MFGLLYRHFLRRFFDNELFAAGSEPRAALITIGVFLGTPGLLVAFFLMPAAIAVHFDPRPLLQTFAFISGLLVALGTVLQWETLFPDATDYEVLRPLPIPSHAILVAKLAALGTLVGGLTLIINGYTATLIPILDAPRHTSLAGLAGLIGRQWTAVAATSGIGFFGLLTVHGILLCAGGHAGLRIFGLRIQVVVLAALIAVLLALPYLAYGAAVRWTWQPAARHWALSLTVAALAFYGAAFHRYLRDQGGAPRRLRAPFRTPLSTALTWIGPGSARTQAVSRFIMLTLARSRRHRLIVAAWVALAAAVVLASGFDLAARMHSARNPYTADDVMHSALAISFILVFFLLAGLRFSFTVPSDRGANWIFQLSEGTTPHDLLAGSRRVLLLYLLPILIPLAPFAAHMWGWRAAGWHLALTAAAGVLWIQLLTQRFDRIPFTCSYRPDRANFKLRWPFYWLFFTLYAYTLTAWEWRELRNPAALGLAIALAGAAAAVLDWERRGWLRGGIRCRFEDPPEGIQRLFVE